MAKTKFKNFAAVIQNGQGTLVAITRWKNITLLRCRRRTSTNNYRNSRIKRIPIDEGINFILDTYGENTQLDNYPNLGFYKFFQDEQDRLKTYFDTIATNSSKYRLSLTDRQQHLPDWFITFISNTFNRALNDYDMWGSWRIFQNEFYNKTSRVFAEHPEVKKLFYDRFEQSLAGTLEKDVISYTRPKPSYKKSSDWDFYENEYIAKYKKKVSDTCFDQTIDMPSFRDNNVLREYISTLGDNVNASVVQDILTIDSLPTPIYENIACVSYNPMYGSSVSSVSW